MGIFWPRAVYAKAFNQEPHPDMLKAIPFASGVKTGVIMEDDGRPLPTGCIRMINYDDVSVKEGTAIAHGDESNEAMEHGWKKVGMPILTCDA